MKTKMKTALSVFLACSMAIAPMATVFASEDETEEYNYAEVAGEYTYDDMTLELTEEGAYTLEGVEGTYTYWIDYKKNGEILTYIYIYADDESAEALKEEVMPIYWTGELQLIYDYDNEVISSDFEPGMDYSLVQISMSTEDGDGGFVAETVEDEDSPTGYMTTFTVPDDGYETVCMAGNWISYKFELTDEDDPTSYSTDPVEPEDWENGNYYNSGSSREMTYDEESDSWTLPLPLASSYMTVACYYNLEADLVAGNVSSGDSICIPYDEEKQSESFDATIMSPRDSENGTVDDTLSFTAEDGYEVNVTVYTPYGYDPDDTDTLYPVMYVVRGMNNELYDNMIAEGYLSPTIFVRAGDYDETITYIEELVAFTEENYNVYMDSDHRAIGGFSLPSMAATVIMMQHPDMFGYACLISGADMLFKNDVGDFTDANTYMEGIDEEAWETIVESWKNMKIHLGSGCVDFNLFDGDVSSASMTQLAAWLDAYDVDYTFQIAKGGHDAPSTIHYQIYYEFFTEILGNWGE
ncbi:MAG: hypothetical protein LUF35_00180 [Lachnospiraceae bacterium]|nr:hypothetical protein [Lachnospiraceae bacterium]